MYYTEAYLFLFIFYHDELIQAVEKYRQTALRSTAILYAPNPMKTVYAKMSALHTKGKQQCCQPLFNELAGSTTRAPKVDKSH